MFWTSPTRSDVWSRKNRAPTRPTRPSPAAISASISPAASRTCPSAPDCATGCGTTRAATAAGVRAAEQSRTPSGRLDVPSTSPGRSLAEQYGRPLPRGPLEPFQGIISSGAFIYSCPYHTCTHASKRNSANAPAGNLWQDAGAGSCRCETVRSHSGSHVRLSRMQSVSLLSDFMRSSCTAQLLHSAAPAQRSSCSAQLLHSAALGQRCISSQRPRASLRRGC